METNQEKLQHKQNLKVRTKTAIIVGAFYVVYLLLLFFSSRFWTNSFIHVTPQIYNHIRFSLNFVNLLLIIVLLYFACQEITHLCSFNKKMQIGTTLLMFVAVMTIALFILLTRSGYVPLPSSFETLFIMFALSTLCVVLLVLGICGVIVLVLSKKKKITNDKALTWYPILTTFLTLFFIAFFYVSVIHTWVTFLAIIMISTLSDMFGYFVGSKIGKHKMTPNISPKKSWEGLIIGSFLITLVIMLGYYGLFFIQMSESHYHGLYSFLGSQTCSYHYDCNVQPYFWGIYVGATLLLIAVSVCGDLFFSWIKRSFKIKDFSNLLPGHGGILDRLDALTFIFIFYFVITIILQFACKNYEGASFLWDVFVL